MKKRWLFILSSTLFFTIAISKAQTKKVNIDSLYHIVKAQPDSKEKVDELIHLYKKSVNQRAIRKDILDDALEISEKNYYLKEIAICYNRKGITARYEQNFGQSVMYHKRALSYFKRTKDTFYKAKCYNSLAVTYRKLNLEKEAFENYLIGLKLSEMLNNKRGVSISLNGIGNVFLNTEQYDKALRYFKQAISIEDGSKNVKNKEYGYANIGEVFLAKKQYDSAYVYFDKSFQIGKKHPHKENIAIKFTLFGKLYEKTKEYQKAIEYYQKAIPQLEEYKNTRYLSKALIHLGINQTSLKQYHKAYNNITKGLNLAKKINSKENISLAYDAFVAYYSAIKDYKSALKSQQQAKVFHDSIVNVTSQKNIISAKIAYETEEKDKQIHNLALAKKQSELKARSNFKRFIITAIISLLSIAFLLVFLYLYRRNSDLELQNKNAELQNYILKISELTEQAKHNNTTDKDISEQFKKYNLSKKEIEVLTHISNGLNNDEISEKMFVSKNTIKTHITHIYTKLDVNNRVQAIKKITNS